jgi:nucleoside-diphosphate-sugar epimerase
MRVLVTGAQGCIGAWIVAKLVAREIPVVAFDLDQSLDRLYQITGLDTPPELVTRSVGRIEDTALVKRVVETHGITHIIHLAAVLMPYCQENPVSGGMINVMGTLNVFEAARSTKARVVYASSSAVWGPEEAYGARKLTEDDPLKPSTHYGVFKQANEGSARAFHAIDGINSVGLRPWTVYGVGRDRGMTADPTLAMKAVVLRNPFRIRLTGPMDMQYVDDVAETFLACALSDIQGAHVFNLAGDIVDMHDLIALLERLRPGAAGLITAEGPRVPVAHRMDDSRLRSMIRVPKTPLETGVQKTIEMFERLHDAGRLSGAV